MKLFDFNVSVVPLINFLIDPWFNIYCPRISFSWFVWLLNLVFLICWFTHIWVHHQRKCLIRRVLTPTTQFRILVVTSTSTSVVNKNWNFFALPDLDKIQQDFLNPLDFKKRIEKSLNVCIISKFIWEINFRY